jgi:hypothetical protein
MGVQPTGSEIHYRAVTVLFVQWSYVPVQPKASRISRYEHFYYRHSIGLSEGQSAYFNTSIYNGGQSAELKLCT